MELRAGAGLTALVLAGSRGGGDPLEAYAGVPHKALVEVGGTTMIERVVGALSAWPRIARIVVATDRADLVAVLPGVQRSRAPVSTMPTQAGPSATVGDALDRLGTPLLVTTADHALLRPEWLAEFVAAVPPDADIAAALAPRAAVEAAAPDSLRTWLRFSDGDFSGANLFFLANPAAAAVIGFWRTLERDRKHPLRMAQRLGFSYALRYRTGRLSLAGAAARLGELAGVARLALVSMSDGRAAIDVDKPDDLDLVRRIVAADAAPPRA